MKVRIYRPAKTAMQSGRAKTNKWVLEYEPQSSKQPEPLMGWVSADDTKGQVRMMFDDRDEAIAFAKRKGLDYIVTTPQDRKLRIKTYADNFANDRRFSWTH